MIRTAIMIEGQDGLTWARWQRLATAVEALGFAGLYRSDHYTNGAPPDKDSLELWISLAWLASHTRHIRFGPLVSPVSFRHPTMTARMAAAVDDLSGGRLVLGLGAGWQEREHVAFGRNLLPLPDRFKRFEEGLAIITQLLHSDTPSSFSGEHYRLQGAILLPRPQRAGGPPVLIGGNGPRLTLPLVARYATEWNGVFLTAARFAELNGHLDQLLAKIGRSPTEVSRSLMTGIRFGRSEAAVQRQLRPGRTAQEQRDAGLVVGTADAVVAQLGALAEAGVQEVMLQWLDQDDIDGLEALAHTVLPQLA